MAVDHSGKSNKGSPIIWTNKLLVQWDIKPAPKNGRLISLTVLPKADVVRYTLNGAEPRNGTDYNQPFTVGPDSARLLIFAESSGLDGRGDFIIPKLNTASGDGGSTKLPDPPLTKPVIFPVNKSQQITSRELVFTAVAKANERSIEFTEVNIKIQEGGAYGQFALTGHQIPPSQLLQAIENLGIGFTPSTPISMSFRANFPTGQDLIDFCLALNISYEGEWREAE